jgi:hypothetical protein
MTWDTAQQRTEHLLLSAVCICGVQRSLTPLGAQTWKSMFHR